MKGTIVFASGKAGDFDIFTLDLASGEVTQLTQGHDLNDQPRWSPDGSTIAFISNRSGLNHVWLMDANGRNQRQLTQGNVHHTHPVWAPDGRSVGCCANYKNKDEIDIWMIPLNSPTTPTVVVEKPGLESEFCFSRDGSKVILAATYAGNYDLFEVPVGGSDRRQLTCHPGRDFAPSLSPDGQYLAFSSSPDWDPGSKRPPINSDIYLMMANGKQEPLKLTSNRGADQHVCWSPDGKYLCYAAGGAGVGSARLQFIDLDAGILKKVDYDRSKLESEIGATVQDSGLLTLLTPDALQRFALYTANPSYFGGERYPDWR